MATAGSTGERAGLAALDAAWDGFFSALRRAKGRAAIQRGNELTLPQVHLLGPLAGGGRARIGELADAAGVAARPRAGWSTRSSARRSSPASPPTAIGARSRSS